MRGMHNLGLLALIGIALLLVYGLIGGWRARLGREGKPQEFRRRARVLLAQSAITTN
jgi:hypothetical protein